jgi:acyl carrier protein
MTRTELTGLLAGWIALITDADPPVLAEDTDLVRDLGLDSLALAELAAKLRSTLKIRVRPGELAADLRVGKILDFIQSRLPP